MKKKTPLLFLHSALGVSEDLRPLMDLFPLEHFELFTFDFAGHGKRTEFPSEFRIDFFAQELNSFLKMKSLTDVIVFGHSMGGHVALYHGAHFEDSPVSRIFTYGTKFNWSEQSVLKELPMLNPDHLSSQFPGFAQTLMEKHGERWKTLLRSTAHLMQNLEKLDGLTKEDLAGVIIPVTLMIGDQDRMVSSVETQLTKDYLNHCEIKTISHSKHEMERANLKEISEIIIKSIH